jgi:uncharacterized protein
MKTLFKEAFQLKDTQCTIISDKQDGIRVAEESIRFHRQQLEMYIESNPKFFYTMEPYPAPEEPLIARLMAEKTEKANVGPMAAVAGVLCDLATRDMRISGCNVAVVENGGEVSAVSTKPIDVALAAGDEPLSRRLGFRLTDFPIGVATSSGRFSHALSFGYAEAATVFCREAGLADAAATAVGNVVKGKYLKSAISRGLNKGMAIDGVEGVIVVYKGHVGTAGRIPQIIRISH